MCIPVLYVHAIGTSGLHEKERRQFVYGEQCMQCGISVSSDSHVAAHVSAYPCPCLNCCFGCLKLRTTCRACNSKHQINNKCCRIIAEDSTFMKYETSLNCSILDRFVWPFCCYYKPAIIKKTIISSDIIRL